MPTYIRIYDTAIMSMMAPGGDVFDAHWDVTRNAARLAKIFAPSRTGMLRRTIRPTRPKIEAPFRARSLIYANARYATVVEQGYLGRIYPRSGRFLAVPRNRNPASGAELYSLWVASGRPKPSPVVFKESVAGQAPQRYLGRGLDAAMAEFRLGGG